MLKKVVYIEGMSCSSCQKRVEEGLKKQREIKEVKVNLREKKAELILNSNISDNLLTRIIEDLGYNVKRIEG